MQGEESTMGLWVQIGCALRKAVRKAMKREVKEWGDERKRRRRKKKVYILMDAEAFGESEGILDPRQVFADLVERVGAAFMKDKHQVILMKDKHQVILNGIFRYGPYVPLHCSLSFESSGCSIHSHVNITYIQCRISASGLKEKLSVSWSADAIKTDVDTIKEDSYIIECVYPLLKHNSPPHNHSPSLHTWIFCNCIGMMGSTASIIFNSFTL
jgi:hypothetical protein